MKKIISVLILPVLLVSLSSCAHNAENDHTLQSEAPRQSSSAHAMVAHPTVRDLAEYEKLITTTYTAPPNFISYNAIRELGNFDGFTYFPTYNGEYYRITEKAEPEKTDHRYYYVLETDNGDRLLFDVLDSKALDSITARSLPDSAKSPQSMLRPKDAEGLYQRGNIYYYYYYGTLSSIWWQEGGNLIRIMAWENSFEKLICNEHPLILKLTTAETAEAAVAEFNAKIAATRQNAEVKGAQ